MNAYKIEILVIDFDNLGEAAIMQEVENVKFPNDCLHLKVKSISRRDIGKWSDEHPLNNLNLRDAEYDRLWKLTDELRNRKIFLLLVEDMDLPKHRVLNHDYNWILRNMGVRNASHPNFNALVEFLKAHI